MQTTIENWHEFPWLSNQFGQANAPMTSYSRLLKDRSRFLVGEVNDQIANIVVACFESETGQGHFFYINSPRREAFLREWRFSTRCSSSSRMRL
jgi:hypothetical protein